MDSFEYRSTISFRRKSEVPRRRFSLVAKNENDLIGIGGRIRNSHSCINLHSYIWFYLFIFFFFFFFFFFKKLFFFFFFFLFKKKKKINY